MNSEHAITAITPSSEPRFTPMHRTEGPDKQKAELRRLRRATGDFEALFLAHMLKSMQKTVGGEKTEMDSGGDVLREVGWEKVAESMARKGGMGLGDMLYEALKGQVGGDAPDTAAAATPDSLPASAPELPGEFVPLRKVDGTAPQ